MARSYKKPWVKDSANSYMKRVFSRSFRRTQRQVLTVFIKTHPREIDYLDLWEEGDSEPLPFEPSFPHPKEVMDQYDICDFRFFCKEEKYKRK